MYMYLMVVQHNSQHDHCSLVEVEVANLATSQMATAATFAVMATAFTAEFFYGLTTFGVAITFHIGFHLSHLAGLTEGTVRAVVVGLALPDAAVALVQSLRLWRECAWALLLLGSVVLLVSLTAGTALLLVVGDSPWLKRVVGLLLFVLALERIVNHGTPREPRPIAGMVLNLRDGRVLRRILCCFSAAGLFGGMVGVAGPPMMLFVSYSAASLSISTWRATSALLRLVLSSSRLTFFIVTHEVDLGSIAALGHHALTICGALGGLATGNRLSHRMRPEVIDGLILCFLGAGSVMLATSGIREPLPLEALTLWSLLGTGPAILIWHMLGKPGSAELASASQGWRQRLGSWWVGSPSSGSAPMGASLVSNDGHAVFMHDCGCGALVLREVPTLSNSLTADHSSPPALEGTSPLLASALMSSTRVSDLQASTALGGVYQY